MLKDQLGDWLEWQRRNHKQWLRILIAILALLVVVNIFVHPPIGDSPGGGHGEAVESHGEAAGHEAVEAESHDAAGNEAAAGHGEAMEETEAQGGHEAAAAHGAEYDFWAVDHPHFVFDAYPGFWAAFGIGVAIIMTLVLKKFVFLLIGKSEDYYERNERY